MAQTKPSQNLSLALSGQKTGQKQKGQNHSAPAQFMALVSALGSLSSVALSSARAQLVYHLFPASLRPGDISTLQKWGHLYFALTGCLLVPEIIRETNGFHLRFRGNHEESPKWSYNEKVIRETIRRKGTHEKQYD